MDASIDRIFREVETQQARNNEWNAWTLSSGPVVLLDEGCQGQGQRAVSAAFTAAKARRPKCPSTGARTRAGAIVTFGCTP